MPQCKGTHGKQRNAKENEPKRNGKWQKVWRKLIANKGKTKKRRLPGVPFWSCPVSID